MMLLHHEGGACGSSEALALLHKAAEGGVDLASEALGRMPPISLLVSQTGTLNPCRWTSAAFGGTLISTPFPQWPACGGARREVTLDACKLREQLQDWRQQADVRRIAHGFLCARPGITERLRPR
jgi:hypothetical protein